MELKKAVVQDLKEIASIHKKIFGDHFIGMLPEFLIRKFYLSFINDRTTFFVNTDQQMIVGFVLGGYSSELNRYRASFIKKNAIYLSLSILFNPKIYPLFLSRCKKVSNEFKTQITYRLLSIGVCEEFKGKGIAQELISKFEQNIKSQNIDKYGLSVHKTNGRAINFYKKCAFLLEGESENLFYFYKTDLV